MSDELDQQGVAVQEQNTVAEAPTAEEQAPVDESDESTTLEETQDADADTSEEDVPEGMPEDQAKAFQEQRLEIKRLKEELSKRSKSESTFDMISRAPAANDNVLKLQIQRELDLTKARIAHPELDPDEDSFDPIFEREVHDKWMGALALGENKSISKVAAELKARLGKTVKSEVRKQTKQIAQEVTQQVKIKEQSSTAAPRSRSDARTYAGDGIEQLRDRTRKGDSNAFAERLKRIEGQG